MYSASLLFGLPIFALKLRLFILFLFLFATFAGFPPILKQFFKLPTTLTSIADLNVSNNGDGDQETSQTRIQFGKFNFQGGFPRFLFHGCRISGTNLNAVFGPGVPDSFYGVRPNFFYESSHYYFSPRYRSPSVEICVFCSMFPPKPFFFLAPAGPVHHRVIEIARFREVM